MYTKLFFFFLSFIPVFVSAQVTQEWVQRYNGPANGVDRPYSLAVDLIGNVYVTGTSYTGTDSDYVTIKYNTSGVQLWLKNYNGPAGPPFNDDVATSIAIDSSKNVYVTGNSDGGSSIDYTTIKYDSSGVQQWVQRYNGPGNNWDEAQSLTVDASGNVYVTGKSYGFPTSYDYATVKYNSSGVQQWVQRYNGPGNDWDEAHSIAVDPFGNVYVTGFTSVGTTDWDYATIKYNSSGAQQWVQRYDGPRHFYDEAQSIAVDASGNAYVTGYSWGIAGQSSDYVTIKYNSSGVQQWIQIYNGTINSNDEATSIAVDAFGNVYVTGSSKGTGYDYATIKYNSSGVQQWVQRYSNTGNNNDNATSLIIDVSGNVYVTGSSVGLGTGNDYATIKYNSSGVQQWVQRYNNIAGFDYPMSIGLDASGNAYVTGYSYGSGTCDYVTVKYSQQLRIQQISTEIPNMFSLNQNYPNPFNPSTNIKFNIPKKSFVKLVIYNSLGKEVASLVNEELNAGSYQADWNASEYPSGVYFYRIELESFIQTKSMVLLK